MTKRNEISNAGQNFEMQSLEWTQSSEYQRQVDAIIGKVPCHADRFVVLCHLLSAKIDEMRNKIDVYCKMQQYRNQLKEEIKQILET